MVRKGYWEVELGGTMFVGNRTVAIKAATAAIDTGTSLIAMPHEDFVNVNTALGAIIVPDLPVAIFGTLSLPFNNHTTDCENLPAENVSITFGNTAYSIRPESYVIEAMNDGEKICISGFSPAGFAPLWIVGDVFLREYYTIYERGTGFFGNGARVGFAKSI